MAAPVAVEYVLAPQSRHVASTEAPVAAEYLPAPQSRHAAEPVPILYFPAPHAVHAPPSGPEKPATHTQSVAASLPVVDCELAGQLRQVPIAVAPVAAEYWPAPQSVHAAEPVDVLYFPATQPKHVPPSGPVEPAAHAGETQSPSASLPAVEMVPPGQV